MGEIDLNPEKDALLIVDVQIDFCPGGALPIPEGDKIIPVLNRWIERCLEEKVLCIFSRDFHPLKHPSFITEGGPWPVHCVQDTEGAKFHPNLIVPKDSIIVTKGTRFDKDQNSAFDETGLEKLLNRLKIKRLFIAGLALDVCVLATVLDSVKYGFETYLIKDGCRPVSKEGERVAISKMKELGVKIL